MLQVTNRSWMGRSRLRSFLSEITESGDRWRSDYLPKGTDLRGQTTASETGCVPLSDVVPLTGLEGTGLAVFRTDGCAVVIIPPFPLGATFHSDGVEAEPLLRMLDTEHNIGIVLLRLGRYAVGVLQGDTLVASKSATRYVKNRHRKGGSSAGRFARSRERLIRELFDKCCEVTRSVFAEHEDSIDYVLLGGEKHTLNGFRKRCAYLRGFGETVLERVLDVDRPGKQALEMIGPQVWKSRVVTLERNSMGLEKGLPPSCTT